MLIDYSQYIAGGYLVAQKAARPGYLSSELLPAKLISVSKCIANIIPDAWAFSWSSVSEDSRLQQASLFNIDSTSLTAVSEWVDTKFNLDKIGWPGVFLSLNTAREFVEKFELPTTDLLLLGIALHKNFVSSFLESEKSPPNLGENGIYKSLERGIELEGGFEPLGFEVLGYGYGDFHSWLCHSLENEVAQQLKIVPNSLGLFSTEEDAGKVFDFVTGEHLKVEEALWLPWRVVNYVLLD